MEEKKLERSKKNLFPPPVSPFPGWIRRIDRLSRPVMQDDIAAFLGNEDLIIRDNGSRPVTIIHKYGLLEINLIIGERDIEVWYSPKQAVWLVEYLDALLQTRF